MSDDHMKVAIDLDVRSTGEELVAQLTRQLHKLESQIRSINAASKSVAQASRPSSSGRNPPSAASTNVQGEAKAKRQSLIFDREQAKAFKTRIASQARAASDAMKAEAQSFKDFRTRNDAQSRFESAQVRALRDRMTAESRIGRMRSSSENDAIRAVKAGISAQNRAFRQRVSEERSAQREQARSVAAAARAEAQRFREAAASIRENARIEAAQVRHVERERSRHETARNRYVSNLRSGGNDIREGTGRVVRGSAQITAATTAPAVLAARKGISTRMQVDAQETNLRIFSGQSTEQISAARKGFLDNEAIKNGLSIAGGLEAYSEVLKTGMKAPEANTKTIMAAVSALELDLRSTTKLAGLIDRNLGARSDPAKIKSALNAVAVAAREDPTQSNEIVEGVKRSFGALSTGNLTPEQLTAMVSGGQSVGIQPGKAGTFVATMAKQLSMGSSKFLGKKNREELNFAARELGFGDARNLAQTYSKDSYNTMMSVHEKLAKMEAAKRTQVAEALYGRQWSDEGLQMAQGVGGVRKTYGEIVDGKNANFLEEAARQRAESLQGQWNSTKSIISRFWDAFGSGFEDILSSINRYFLELNASFDYDKVKSYVVSFFEGVKDALGVKTWTELLHNLFGGDIGNIGPSIRAFAKGLTEGVMAVGRAIRGVASIFAGGNLSAETIGNLTGKFIALSAALVMLGPVLGILGGLASIVMGLAVASKAIAGLAGLATRGAASSAAGAAAGTGILMKGLGLALSRMFALSVVAEIGEHRGAISTWLLESGKSLLQAAVDGIKAAFSKESIQAAMRGIVSEFIPAPVQRWMDNDGQLEAKKGAGKTVLDNLPKGIPATPAAPINPNERGVIGRAWDWLSSSLVGSAAASEFVPPSKVTDRAAIPSSIDPRPAMEGLKDAIEENTLLHRQSLDKAEGFGGLIHRASLSSTTSANAVKASISEPASGVRQAILTGSLGSGSYSPGPLEGSIPGSRLNGGGGLGYRGIIGGSGSAHGAGPGGGVVSPTFRGDQKAIAKTAFDFFRSKGLSAEAASGILANIDAESSFNPRARGDGGRAHGLFQHHGDRRAAILRGTGIDMSTASVEDQLRGTMWEMENGDRGAQRALRILRTPGISARDAGAAFVKHFERPARDERAIRGSMAEGFVRQFGGGGAGASSGGVAAAVGAGSGQYDGLKVKGGQAIAGGNAYSGVTDLARQVQESLPGGVKHFSAFNDRYHQGRRSKHNEGLAFDTTLIDGSKSIEAAEAIRNKMRAAGLQDKEFRVIDEYRNPSPHSTGGHIHSQFNNAEAAKKYSDHVAALKKPAQDMASMTEGLVRSSGWKMESLTERAESIRSSGWRPSKVEAPTLGDGPPGSAPMARTSLADAVPPRNIDSPSVSGHRGGNANGGGSSSSSATINVNGAGMSAEAVANAVQRRLNEGMNRRTHDLDPSMI